MLFHLRGTRGLETSATATLPLPNVTSTRIVHLFIPDVPSRLYLHLLTLRDHLNDHSKMDGFGLPMSFGKKAKGTTVNVSARLNQTKRADNVSLESRWLQYVR